MKKVLAAVDFTSQCQNSFAHACAFAQKSGGEVHAVHAIRLPPYVGFELLLAKDPDVRLEQWIREQAGAQMSGFVPSGSGAKPHLIVGDPAEVILEFAESEGVELIVLGLAGHRTFGLGRTASSIIRSAPCPVLTTHSEGSTGVFDNVKSILVPVDFSGSSTAALDFALRLAERDRSKVTVVHASPHPAHMTPALSSMEQMVTDTGQTVDEFICKDYEQQMQAIIDRIEIPKGVEVDHRLERQLPETAIAGLAPDYDVVVMGTHGRSGAAGFFMGSVAEKTIRKITTPVITVRSPAVD